MKFRIDKAWHQNIERYRSIDTAFENPDDDWSRLVVWLDEYVGWVINDSIATLPVMGQGWRVAPEKIKEPESEYYSWGIMLEIDDDALALQYKLTFE